MTLISSSFNPDAYPSFSLNISSKRGTSTTPSIISSLDLCNKDYTMNDMNAHYSTYFLVEFLPPCADMNTFDSLDLVRVIRIEDMQGC
jgi:hypothetical protein